jgi:NAD(P)-dependent dehydrogenase (short-subunit alcohol dehydrogenase family)
MTNITATSDMVSRKVIITGGAGGAGHMVTQRWLERGASVLVVDAAQAALEGLQATLPAPLKDRLATFAADLTTEAGAALMVSEATDAFKRPADTLIHLVGGYAFGPLDGPDAPRNWDRMMALNLTAAFRCYRAVLPSLRERGGGWIVGMGSRAATDPGADLTAYAASKAGLIALTQSLAAEVRGAGIHVNLMLASTIDTPATRRALGTECAADWVTPEDVADATLYLCSEQARAVHGATLELYANA